MNTFDPRRRATLAATAALLASLLAGRGAHAQGPERFPNRPVTLWVPWPPGGATDLAMRVLAEIAGRQLGQKVLVENRPGAGGTLAMSVLQQSAPDGYHIAQIPQPVFRAPFVTKVSWDPIRDTTPIIQLSGVTFGVVVAPNSPFKSLEDVFAFAKDKPGDLNIATNGVGTTPHVVMDDLFARRSLGYVHVPYKGTSEQMLAVMAGTVQVGVNSNGFAPFVDEGRLRLLVTFGEKRSKRWPQVPTLKELGFGIVATSPYGLSGPAGMPAAVVQTLHDAFKAALFDPAHVAELAKYDQDVEYLGPDDYGRAMREVYASERRAAERLTGR